MVITGTDVEVSDNSFVSIGAGDGGCVVIQTYRDSDNDISGLSIHDNTFGGTPDVYVGVWINHTLTGSGAVTIANNAFSGNIYQGIVTERSNTVIRHNSLINDPNALAKVGYGMIVMDWGPTGNKVDARPQDNVQIKDNTIANFKYGALIGNNLGQTLTDVTLIKNVIRDVNTAVMIRSGADGVSLNFNNLIRADANAVLNTDPNNTVDAEYNWWGEPDDPNAPTGPLDDSDDTASGGLYNPDGLGEPVSDQVDYDPWLTVPISDSDDPVAYIHGDVNGDGKVDWLDFAILANHWLEGTGP